jgi:hypothetical protein
MLLVHRSCRQVRHPVRYGLGQCRICSCIAFRGQGNQCEDCGHHYGDHTTKPFRTGVTGPHQPATSEHEAEGGVRR